MNRLRHILQAILWTSVVLTILIVVVYESHWLLEGGWADRSACQFVWQIVMELATIVAIPVALFLFRFKRIHRLLAEGRMKALHTWSIVRLLMLCVPIVLNAVLYYQFMAVAFGYMSIILLLSLFFVYPSKTRCEQEMAELDDGEKLEQNEEVADKPDGQDEK